MDQRIDKESLITEEECRPTSDEVIKVFKDNITEPLDDKWNQYLLQNSTEGNPFYHMLWFI